MRFIDVSELLVGMVVAKDIINDRGIEFLNKGTVLTNAHIKNLQKFDIDFIYVEDDESKKKFSDNNLTQLYENVLVEFKNAYMDVRLGKNLNLSSLESNLYDLISEVIKSNDILNTLKYFNFNDIYTYLHSVNVSLISAIIGKWMKLDRRKIYDLALSALLHDIGKSQITLSVINKPGALNEKELEEARMHAKYSIDIAKAAGIVDKDILDGIFYHHERQDGTGYPIGLENGELSLFPRIIAVADVFDALISDKVYRRKVSPFKAMDIINELSYEKLDTKISVLFMKNISDFYVGSKIKLSTGEIGEIVFLNKYCRNRPLVKTAHTFIDLSTDYSIEIVEWE